MVVPCLLQHQAHPDVTLYILSCLRVIAEAVSGQTIPRVPTAWIEDVAVMNQAQQEEVAKHANAN